MMSSGKNYAVSRIQISEDSEFIRKVKEVLEEAYQPEETIDLAVGYAHRGTTVLFMRYILQYTFQEINEEKEILEDRIKEASPVIQAKETYINLLRDAFKENPLRSPKPAIQNAYLNAFELPKKSFWQKLRDRIGI